MLKKQKKTKNKNLELYIKILEDHNKCLLLILNAWTIFGKKKGERKTKD